MIYSRIVYICKYICITICVNWNSFIGSVIHKSACIFSFSLSVLCTILSVPHFSLFAIQQLPLPLVTSFSSPSQIHFAPYQTSIAILLHNGPIDRLFSSLRWYHYLIQLCPVKYIPYDKIVSLSYHYHVIPQTQPETNESILLPCFKYTHVVLRTYTTRECTRDRSTKSFLLNRSPRRW